MMKGTENLKNPFASPVQWLTRRSCFCSFTSVFKFQSHIKITSSPKFNLLNFCSLFLSSLFSCLKLKRPCLSKQDSQGRTHLRAQETMLANEGRLGTSMRASFLSHCSPFKNVIKNVIKMLNFKVTQMWFNICWLVFPC